MNLLIHGLLLTISSSLYAALSKIIIVVYYNWLENRNYSVTITKRYMTKTIMQVEKDGITEELHLTFGEKNLGHTAMEQFGRTLEIKRENIRLKEELKKIKK